MNSSTETVSRFLDLEAESILKVDDNQKIFFFKLVFFSLKLPSKTQKILQVTLF